MRRFILDYYLLTAPKDAPEVYRLTNILQQDEIDPETAAEIEAARARLEELVEKNQKK